MDHPSQLVKNKILASLSAEEYQRLSPNLESVDLLHGKVLYEMGQPIEYVYFPSNAMISLVRK